MKFQVRHYRPPAPAVIDETLESDTQAALEARLGADGSVVLSVRTLGAVPSVGLGPSQALWASMTRKRGPRLDVAWWCRELKTLLVAGMTAVEAIETLHAQSSDTERGLLHGRLVGSLRQGQPLSQAMQGTGAFPSILVAGVRASERTSTLIEALDDFLRFHAMLEHMRKKLVSAAIYPAVVMSLGFLICAFLLMFVIPRFSRMYAGLHGAVSLPTELLIGLSAALQNRSHWVLFALVAVVAAGIAAWQTGWLARRGAELVESVGPLRVRIDDFRLAKLYQSLALLVRGGYPLDDALRQCADLGLGGRLAVATARCKGALERGERVSTAFAQAGLTDVVSLRLMAVGERSGDFDRVLSTVAERHAERFASFIDRTTRVVEPLLLLGVALVVGGIVVMMYMPIFDIAGSVR